MLTLSAYLLDAASELKKASEILFVHRNTVLYRLNKIKKSFWALILQRCLWHTISMLLSRYIVSTNKMHNSIERKYQRCLTENSEASFFMCAFLYPV